MKNYVKNFCSRGMSWSWTGPVILSIVALFFKFTGNELTFTTDEMVLAILSSLVLAFVATGISIVYEIETLPKATAGLIQGAVLLADYLVVYLINGWLPLDQIWIFVLSFIAGFAIIWFIIYISIKNRIAKVNSKLQG
ncbi:MAG: DUF3021 domain-containing protein [Erysipelotrichaceae bacterium]|nr:DUF3021 domain-containing protein [Erysipelotrichaceae bacterium]